MIVDENCDMCYLSKATTYPNRSSMSKNLYNHTVKPVYNDHSRDQVMVVFVDRWSLYRRALVSLRWPMEQPTVVTIDRWVFLYKWSQTFHCTNTYTHHTYSLVKHRHTCIDTYVTRNVEFTLRLYSHINSNSKQK